MDTRELHSLPPENLLNETVAAALPQPPLPHYRPARTLWRDSRMYWSVRELLRVR
jgi:hypothetical protein